MPAIGVAVVVVPAHILVRDVDEVAFSKILQESLGVAPATWGRAIDRLIRHVDGVRLDVIHERASLVTEVSGVTDTAALEWRGGVCRTRGGACRTRIFPCSRRGGRHGVKADSLRSPGRRVIRRTGCDCLLLRPCRRPRDEGQKTRHYCKYRRSRYGSDTRHVYLLSSRRSRAAPLNDTHRPNAMEA